MALQPPSSFTPLQPPSSGHRPSNPLALYVVLPVHLCQRRPRRLSWSATSTPVLFSASAAPLTSHSGHNNQTLDKLLETDGSGWDGGCSGGGAVGAQDGDSNSHRKMLLMAVPSADWPVDNLPADSDGSERFFELEKSPLPWWQLADDGFLEKASMELGIENFFKEPEIVFADVIALPGSSYSLTQRLGAIALNGAKLFALGTASSMLRTAVRNALIDARKAVEKSSSGEVERVPILYTSLAYGVHMAISDNLRSQVLDSVIEQRILEPLLHQHKLMLSAIRFAVQTGDTFLGSLLWTHYARLIGIQ